jgi:cytosine/adenosine deaminase-related metal-dependent hydrolase
MPDRQPPTKYSTTTVIRGARYAAGPSAIRQGSLKVVSGKLLDLPPNSVGSRTTGPSASTIDLDGFLVLPGFINAHDHLQYALHPRLGRPPYNNYIEWGEDIHSALSEFIALYNSVPKEIRLWWGGIRNLLSGVTTVCHHDKLWPTLQQKDYPLKVIQEHGWSHSLALGLNLHEARSTTPPNGPFIVHACEGTDELARGELTELDQQGLLDARTVIVHGLAIDESGVTLMRQRRASLILCLSSNQFLFGQMPNLSLVYKIEHIALGTDSPLTAIGDMLDEVRFAIEHNHVAPDLAFRMITNIPATILRLNGGEGTIQKSASADLMAIRDTGDPLEARLRTLSWIDVEFVMVAGQVQLASEQIWKRLPEETKPGLEPLWIDGIIRWLRAPVSELLRETDAALGSGTARLGGRRIKLPKTNHAKYFSECNRSQFSVGRRA